MMYHLYDIHDMVRGILYNDANTSVYTVVPTHVCIQIHAGFGVTLLIARQMREREVQHSGMREAGWQQRGTSRSVLRISSLSPSPSTLPVLLA